MIEEPQTGVFLKLEQPAKEAQPLMDEKEPLEGEDNDAPPAYVDVDVLETKPALITSKFRTTIKHLRAKAGFFSRFRGLAVYGMHGALQHLFLSVFPTDTFLSRALFTILTAVFLARIDTIWTHMVISEPGKPWYRRSGGGIMGFKKVAGATALQAAAMQLTIGLPYAFYKLLNLPTFVEEPQKFFELDTIEQRLVMLQVALVVFLGIGVALAILVPANATLVRVQASLLPEDEEPIVPMDRTFHGAVVPESEGGDGKLSLYNAWKTFDKFGRLRLLKVYAKTEAMRIALHIAFFAAYLAELRIIFGDQMPAIMAKVHEAMHQH